MLVTYAKMKKYAPGQLLVKKWSKQGLGFKRIGPGAYTSQNTVFLSAADALIFLGVEDASFRGDVVSFAMLLSRFGIVFYPIAYLMTMEEHEREKDFS